MILEQIENKSITSQSRSSSIIGVGYYEDFENTPNLSDDYDAIVLIDADCPEKMSCFRPSFPVRKEL